MKKLLCLLLSCTLCTALAACGESSPAPEATEPEAPAEQAEESMEQEIVYPEFDIPVGVYVEVVDSIFESAGKKKMTDYPVDESNDTWEGGQEVVSKQYNMADGIVVTYIGKKDGNMLMVLFTADVEKAIASSSDILLDWSYLMGVTLGYLAKDDAERMAKELNMDNMLQENSATSFGDGLIVSYEVKGGKITATFMAQ